MFPNKKKFLISAQRKAPARITELDARFLRSLLVHCDWFLVNRPSQLLMSNEWLGSEFWVSESQLARSAEVGRSPTLSRPEKCPMDEVRSGTPGDCVTGNYRKDLGCCSSHILSRDPCKPNTDKKSFVAKKRVSG